jgi:hypothetical protein
LRARAQKNRWNEEYILVGYEMNWVVRFFYHRAKLWETRQTGGIITAGAAAYAARQHARWLDIAAAADRKFKSINPNHIFHIT